MAVSRVHVIGSTHGYSRWCNSAVFWVHYLPDLKWLKRFRGYVQYLTCKAEKSGAELE